MKTKNNNNLKRIAKAEKFKSLKMPTLQFKNGILTVPEGSEEAKVLNAMTAIHNHKLEMAYSKYIRDGREEMDVHNDILEKEVKRLNEIGIEVTVEEISEIVESKFVGKQQKGDFRRSADGSLMYPNYTVIK